MNIKELKKEIRKSIIGKRNKIKNKDKTSMDNKIIESFKKEDSYKKARGIFIYIGFGSEINTKVIIEDALKKGKEVYVPKVKGKEMLLIKIDSLENLVTSSYGILEPIGDNNNFDVDKLDLLVMPGVAFDNSGNRIGYGGGYYDRFLEKNKTNAEKIALAYEFQILNSINNEKHDVKVDKIITEERIINISR
ncbi:5-formyltetrahydrofolate cyclo-ligase [Clostridium moniliforme]|uniref:5-formyltetrahydrofolate cyclo-ligase n=1 Tax=Clostridium moniliforme TaxID=39489 RepID=A0ABS4F1G5_9CLOT|nr:5-formyltetrahydrofolate cyclo-ligase [Clostridium moniliforme]MBP1890091.1 5-formyltetrahydrofolate cyclo-ligase [Clostridium moniliforme]